MKRIGQKILRIIMCAVMLCNILLLTGCDGTPDLVFNTEDLQERFQYTRDTAKMLSELEIITGEQYESVIKNVLAVEEWSLKLGSGALTEDELVNILTSYTADGSSKETISYTENGKEKSVEVSSDGVTISIKDAINAYRILDGTVSVDEGKKTAACTSLYKVSSSNADTFKSEYEDETDYLKVCIGNFIAKKVIGIGSLSEGDLDVATDGDWFQYHGGIGVSQIYGNDVANWGQFSTDVKPLNLVGDDVQQTIADVLSEYEVYVLKPNMGRQVTELESAFDSICLEIQSAMKEKNDTKLDTYFQPADKSLMDILNTSGSDGALVKQSRGNDTSENSNGKDLVIVQKATNGNKEPVLSIRVQEFDKEACDTVNKIIGLLNGDGEGATRYKVNSESKRIYVMEYPIYAINKISESGSGSDKYKVSYVDSGIGINLGSHKLIGYQSSGSSYTNSGTYIEPKGGSYLTSLVIDGNSNKSKAENSSFAVVGYTTMNLGLKDWLGDVANSDINAEIPRIIMRDYLEATYAPGYSDSGPTAAFGRKIRFIDINKYVEVDTSKKNSQGDYQRELVFNNDDYIASYVNFSGVKSDNNLRLRDFCDITSLESKQVKILGDPKELNMESVKSISAQSSIEELGVTGVSSITCTEVFPPNIDYSGSPGEQGTQQRFWAIAVSNSMFNNGLYNTWIKSTDPQDSMIWWNEYLKANGYEYSTEYSQVKEWLITSYSVQMQREGEYLIDLDTIAKIRDILQEEDDYKTTQTIRTLFVIIGWFIAAFSLILVVLWAIDTNTDLGFNLLTKVTLGNWIAVKYADDIPMDTTNGTKYITGQKIIIRSIIIMAVGIFLIVFNVFDLVNWLIVSFGDLASEVEKIIRGIK